RRTRNYRSALWTLFAAELLDRNNGDCLSRRRRLLGCIPIVRPGLAQLSELAIVAACGGRAVASGVTRGLPDLLHPGCPLTLHARKYARDNPAGLYSNGSGKGSQRAVGYLPSCIAEFTY